MDALSWPLHELLVMTAREESLLKDYFVLCLEAAYTMLNIPYSFYQITNIFQYSDNKMYAAVKLLLYTYLYLFCCGSDLVNNLFNELR